MELDRRQTIIIAIIILFLGKYLNRKVKFLREYNLPEPVTGGIVASLFFSILHLLFDVTVEFSLHSRDNLLIIFFTTIGLSSRLSTLFKGGRALLVLLVLAVCYLFIQNFTGIGVAKVMGLMSQIGLIGGSVSLSGGHGTTIAWAPVFTENYGIDNAMEIGIACATFGLVLGGLIGGPIARMLIKKYHLKPSSHEQITVGFKNEKKGIITVDAFFVVLLVISIVIGFGIQLNQIMPIQLPTFVTCLFGGILFTNIALVFLKNKAKTIEHETATLALISEFSLGLFLTMSLMSLQLWTLIDLALPILLLLLGQVIVITVFVVFMVFPLLGKDYDAAITCSGYAGMALGATPTAIANMTAVTKRFGAAPKAFIIVPLVGAFFIDISNAVIIQTIMSWLL